jgi:peptide chain release factor subunit 1
MIEMEKINRVDAEIFKRKIKELQKYKGKHTELITLYVPPGADRSTIMNMLTQEISQSSNIKAPSTRKNVQSALKKIINFLKAIDFNIPKNGIVLFSGNVSEVEGRTDIKLFRISPIKKQTIKLYWCDSTFNLKHLEEMLTPDNIYGLVVIDNREATLGILSGKKPTILSKLTSAVPGKIKAGGQSARRYERLRIDAANEFYARISERINKEFMPYLEKIDGIIIGGPGHSKKNMVDREVIDYRLREKILGFLDITYTDESGIKELLDSSEDILKDSEIKQEQKVVHSFLEKVAKNSLATYGFKEVIEALEEGRVEKVLISEKFKWEFIKAVCLDCEKAFDVIKKDKLSCPKCNSENIEVIEEIDPIEYIYEKTKESNAEVNIISTDTSEGEQFFMGFGGLGAILRY